jgi:hypothetical protein
MERFFDLICELGETDAEPIARCLVAMIFAFGVVVCAGLYMSSRPYTYRVQCSRPSDAQSHVILTSRTTGLVDVGPVVDASGVAAISSDANYSHYDITLGNSPCRYVGP